MNLRHFWLCLLMLSAVTGCKAVQGLDGCTTDTDCNDGFICQSESRSCHCITDDSCATDEYCNTQGYCQSRPPCRSNQDCSTNEICDVAAASGGTCIAKGSCGANTHCAFNEFCNPRTRACEAGCRSSSDCQLGNVCSAGKCQAGLCSTCPVSPDADSSYCDYGDVCTLNGACQTHRLKASLCKECDQLTPCPNGLVCLIDNEGSNYCAATCANDADCPGGYTSEGCRGVIAVQEECTGGRSCSNGGRCIQNAEGRGFCECRSQRDCDALGGMCMPGLNKCLGTGFACRSNADCQLSCVQTQDADGSTYGACETNQKVCGKEGGVTCETLTRGTPPCESLQSG